MLGNEGGSVSKMQVISERWQEIQVSMDREKNYRLQSIEEQVAALDDRITNGRAFSQQKLQVLAEKTAKAREAVQELQERREEIGQTVDRRLAKAEEALAGELAAERASREEYREGWMRKCDEKLLDVCNSMESLTTEKGETVESTTVRIRKRLTELEASIEEERKRREAETARVTEAVEQDLNKLYGQLEIQRKERELKGRKIEGMLKDIQLKLEGEVEDERRLRKQTNASLLTLLEQTCLKVEKAFQ